MTEAVTEANINLIKLIFLNFPSQAYVQEKR